MAVGLGKRKGKKGKRRRKWTHVANEGGTLEVSLDDLGDDLGDVITPAGEEGLKMTAR